MAQSVKLLLPMGEDTQNPCENPDVVVKCEPVTGRSLEGCCPVRPVYSARIQAIKRPCLKQKVEGPDE